MIRLNWIHHIHGILFVFLLSSGLFLYFSPTRTWFNEIQFPLVSFHLWVSLFYGFVILFSLRSVFQYINKKPYIKSFNVWLNVSFIAVWFISGLVMFFQANVPVGLGNVAVQIHGWFTFLFLPWVVVHSIGHLLKTKFPWPSWWRGKAKLPQTVVENQLERRDFVKFTLLGILFLFVGAGIKWLQPLLDVAGEENKRSGYFKIYNVTNDYPDYEGEQWQLTIDGRVEESTVLTMSDIRRMPSKTIVDDFHCVTGWSVRNLEIKGVLIKDIFEEYQITPLTSFVTAYSGDQMYYDSYTLAQLVDEEAMIVFQFDGEELINPQGYPCRLFHPGMYGYKSIKWIERLQFTEEREQGYWQVRGDYDLNGYL